jgi:hypothetical protein
MVGLIVAAETDGLEYDDQRGKAHGELREQIVECNGEREVETMN